MMGCIRYALTYDFIIVNQVCGISFQICLAPMAFLWSIPELHI